MLLERSICAVHEWTQGKLFVTDAERGLPAQRGPEAVCGHCVHRHFKRQRMKRLGSLFGTALNVFLVIKRHFGSQNPEMAHSATADSLFPVSVSPTPSRHQQRSGSVYPLHSRWREWKPSCEEACSMHKCSAALEQSRGSRSRANRGRVSAETLAHTQEACASEEFWQGFSQCVLLWAGNDGKKWKGS